MTFDEWLRLEGLSESSVLKYAGAIEGPLSEWAARAGLAAENIKSIGSQSKFDALAIEIRKLPVFEERNSTGHNMYSSALNKYSEFLSECAVASIDEDIEEIVTSPAIDATQKVRLVNARIGQGQFRQELVEHWKQCAVTGFRTTSMLVASHIKPWSRSSKERLNKS